MSDFSVLIIVVLIAVLLSIGAILIIHFAGKAISYFFSKHRPRIVIYRPKHRRKMQEQQK